MGKKKKQKQAEYDLYDESDETFAYIAGYTSGGFAYGITWDELRRSQLDPDDPHKEYRESFDMPDDFWDLDHCDYF